MQTQRSKFDSYLDLKKRLKKVWLSKINFVYLSMKDKEIIIMEARRVEQSYSLISKMLHDMIFKVRPSTKCATPTDGQREGATA